jgi:hypothetical protein
MKRTARTQSDTYNLQHSDGNNQEHKEEQRGEQREEKDSACICIYPSLQTNHDHQASKGNI